MRICFEHVGEFTGCHIAIDINTYLQLQKMVNPRAFQGSHKDFLLSQKATYSAGIAGGYAADALAIIQQQYFKWYPIDLPHDQEPDAEALASVDYDAPDIEQEEPDEAQLGPKEYAATMSALEE